MADVAAAYMENFGSKFVDEPDISFFSAIIDSLEMNDADTLDECFGLHPALDRALKEAGYGSYD